MGDFKLLARHFSLPPIFLHKFFVILGRLPSSLSAHTPNGGFSSLHNQEENQIHHGGLSIRKLRGI